MFLIKIPTIFELNKQYTVYDFLQNIGLLAKDFPINDLLIYMNKPNSEASFDGTFLYDRLCFIVLN